jgi:hypothetical protein
VEELDCICQSVVSESLQMYVEKAYALLLFSENNVIKIFDKSYSRINDTLTKEYNWDRQFEYLCPIVIRECIECEGRDVLITKRLPSESNICFALSRKIIRPIDILRICEFLERFKLPRSDETYIALYRRFTENAMLQVEQLLQLHEDSDLPLMAKEYIVNISNTVFVSSVKNKRVCCVHGNLFSSNIFLHCGEVIIIDPISDNHIASVADRIMDIATFFVDISIFYETSTATDIRCNIEEKMFANERYIFKIYYILKLLVRLRFAFLERGLHNNDYDININEAIIRRVPTLLFSELTKTKTV